MYRDDLDEWAQDLSEEQIAELAARYCRPSTPRTGA
jgi:hypothetical protein